MFIGTAAAEEEEQQEPDHDKQEDAQASQDIAAGDMGKRGCQVADEPFKGFKVFERFHINLYSRVASKQGQAFAAKSRWPWIETPGYDSLSCLRS